MSNLKSWINRQIVAYSTSVLTRWKPAGSESASWSTSHFAPVDLKTRATPNRPSAQDQLRKHAASSVGYMFG